MMRYYIFLVLTLLMLPAGAQEVKDYTTKVKNTTTAWGGTGTYKAGSLSCTEYYAEGHFYHGTFSQTVTGLPVGVYEAEVYFNASCAAWSCEEICGNGTTGRTHLFMNDVEVDVPIYNVKQIEEPTLYTLKGIHVTDGTLYLGARNDREGANWHLIRLKSLKYLGTDTRSLYDAQFPLIRRARQALAASTCSVHRQLLQTAINESLVASAYDSQEKLQGLYDNITSAIDESETFEKKKATALKNLLSRLDSFQRVWNNGGRVVADEQWSVLLPAVRQACRAKDDECDVDAMTTARQTFIDAMSTATAVLPLYVAPEASGMRYAPDGRPVREGYRGVVIEGGGKKVLR